MTVYTKIKERHIMKTKLAILIVVLLTGLSGCVTPPKKIKIEQEFDVAEARALMAKGTNSIHGSALARQRGGGVVTCAGNEVILTPATEYAAERMLAIYGDGERGYNPASGGKRIVFEDQHPLYEFFTETVLCDVQGFFKFDNVADGTFYIVSEVVWGSVGAGNQGGSMMQEVTLKGGESKEIVLAP
jgi:hypothetical protein